LTPTSTAPASLTWIEVTARRMASHALTEPGGDVGPADIAGVMCGAHAHVLSAAELAIGRRIAGGGSRRRAGPAKPEQVDESDSGAALAGHTDGLDAGEHRGCVVVSR